MNKVMIEDNNNNNNNAIDDKANNANNNLSIKIKQEDRAKLLKKSMVSQIVGKEVFKKHEKSMRSQFEKHI